MRAKEPDIAGTIDRDGLTIGYEVFGREHAGNGPTILLLPAWTIIHTRFWKMQVPYLGRHHQVIVYDGPGNGMSDRSTDPKRYSADAYAADAAAVLEACDAQRFVAVGLSRGAWYAIELAALRPASAAGLVLVGPALPVTEALEQRQQIADRFLDPAPEQPTGWDRYNLAFWHARYPDFARWFFEQVFSEPHSSKALDDAVSWALETGPAVLEAEAMQPPTPRPVTELLGELRCPTLVIHGSEDGIQSPRIGAETARLAGGTFLSMEGSGHIPNVRDPVRFNLVLREFVERVMA